ncbi:hypothetical protein F01_190043 [Burkholderia cenocepacia]|nr:hypothetical protein F01_190043 [Burkholderia cenocepacia]
MTSAAPMTRSKKSGKKAINPTSRPRTACAGRRPNGLAFKYAAPKAQANPARTSEFETRRNRMSLAATNAAQTRNTPLKMKCAIAPQPAINVTEGGLPMTIRPPPHQDDSMFRGRAD